MAAGCEGLKIHLVHEMATQVGRESPFSTSRSVEEIVDIYGELHSHLRAKNHFIILTPPPEEKGDPLAVRHLIVAAQEQTGLPVERMKLIFKGKSLTQCGDLNQSLSSLGLRHGSKVMVLGSKAAVENETVLNKVPSGQPHSQGTNSPLPTNVRTLVSTEQRLQAEETTLSALLQQGQQLSSQGGRDPALLEQVRKGLLASEECLMRLLESLDTLRFDPSDADARSRRKALVNQIQLRMDQCEEMLARVKQTLATRK